MSAMVRFTRVTKRYPTAVTALDGVSFSLDRGEFAFLTGPSGAGKSSILKLIFVEELPTAGEVKVIGQSSVTLSAAKIPSLRRKVGMVFQDFRLLPDRSVAVGSPARVIRRHVDGRGWVRVGSDDPTS